MNDHLEEKLEAAIADLALSAVDAQAVRDFARFLDVCGPVDPKTGRRTIPKEWGPYATGKGPAPPE